MEVGKLIAKAQINDLEPEAGCTMMETFERQVNMALNKARDDAGKAAQISLQETNNVVRMVQAGSKGSFINISQVSSRINEVPCIAGLASSQRRFAGQCTKAQCLPCAAYSAVEVVNNTL